MIRAYENKIDAMKKEKIILQEKQLKQPAPSHDFDEMLELLLHSLASLWKVWERGDIDLRRLVLKLAFADRLAYCRETGPRTLPLSMPVKALDEFAGVSEIDGGA